MLLIEDVVEQEFDRVSDFDSDLNFDEDRPTDGGLHGGLMTESPDGTAGGDNGCVVEMEVGYPGNPDRVDVLRTAVWLPRSVWRAISLEDEATE